MQRLRRARCAAALQPTSRCLPLPVCTCLPPPDHVPLPPQAFCGYTRTAVECLSCGHVSKTFECCTSLALEVSARLTSLEAALARFAATERLDGDNK